MSESTYSYCPGRLRKRARYRMLVDGAHAAWAVGKISSEIKGGGGTTIEERVGLQVSDYKRGEGDLEGKGAPLV